MRFRGTRAGAEALLVVWALLGFAVAASAQEALPRPAPPFDGIIDRQHQRCAVGDASQQLGEGEEGASPQLLGIRRHDATPARGKRLDLAQHGKHARQGGGIARHEPLDLEHRQPGEVRGQCVDEPV